MSYTKEGKLQKYDSYLIKEDLGYILLETGGRIIIENAVAVSDTYTKQGK